MKHLFYSAALLVLASCNKNNNRDFLYREETVSAGTHKLAVYNISNPSAKYLIVFETGLGDDSKIWKDSRVPEYISNNSAVLLYDRAGYGHSEKAITPRDVAAMRTDLEKVVEKYAAGRKVILVGHSLGGYIIRDYAIKNKLKTAALLFVDPSHELYNGSLSQELEDAIYNGFKSVYGENFGGTMEAKELIEDAQYMSALSNLPDIPTTVLTSMKTTAPEEHTAADRELWYAAHESLRKGVTDFTHITTTASGHYIMKTEPLLILEQIKNLVKKLQ